MVEVVDSRSAPAALGASDPRWSALAMGLGWSALAVTLGVAIAMDAARAAGDLPAGLAVDETPCWFFEPSTSQRNGSVGIARTIALNRKASTIARMRAAQALVDRDKAEGLGYEQVAEAVEGGDSPSMSYGGANIRFPATFESGGYIFAYAVDRGEVPDSALKACPAKARADPRECQPRWICSPSTSDAGGIVGVSERTANLPDQTQAAVGNALRFLKYSYGVQVEGQEAVLRSAGRVGGLNLHLQDFGLETTGQVPENASFSLRGIRYVGSRLYIWLVSDDLPPLPQKAREYGLDWRTQPSPDGIFGTLGAAKRPWDGRVSTQVDAAIRNGLISFAKAVESDVHTIEKVKQTEAGTTNAEATLIEVQKQLKARLLSLHVKEDDELLVWIGRALDAKSQ